MSLNKKRSVQVLEEGRRQGASVSSAAVVQRRRTTASSRPMTSQEHLLRRVTLHHQAQLNRQLQQQVSSLLVQDTMNVVKRQAALQSLLDEHRLWSRVVQLKFTPLDTTYSVIAFGSNEMGQLALVQDMTPTNNTTNNNDNNNDNEDDDDKFYTPQWCRQFDTKHIQKMAVGGQHGVAISKTGQVYTWGCGDDGALGRECDLTSPRYATMEPADAYTLDAYTPNEVTGFVTYDSVTRQSVSLDKTIVQAAAGTIHTTFLTASGDVFCCGGYREDDKVCDVQDAVDSVVGVNKTPVHKVIGQPVTRIFSGSEASSNAALLQDGTLVTWGLGPAHQLGRSEDMVEPDKDGYYDVSQKAWVFEANDEKCFNQTLLKEKFLTPLPVLWDKSITWKPEVVHVSCGGKHMLVSARKPGDWSIKAYGCGMNDCGQLGLGKKDHEEFKDRCFLRLTEIQGLEHESVSSVAAGTNHSLVLTHDGLRIYAMGGADKGQLGTGLEAWEDRVCFQPTVVQFPAKSKSTPRIFTDIAAGNSHSIAIADAPETVAKSEVWTWGNSNDSCCTGFQGDYDFIRPQMLDLTTVSEGESHVAAQAVHVGCGSDTSMLLVLPID